MGPSKNDHVLWSRVASLLLTALDTNLYSWGSDKVTK
ncbi:uncharacterized protein G2W53_037569 [Senna tora]|uniref:Uncharacterized protein n=1 Tax=Senna tora TaxID=362788 RepID=A0A834SMK0_9FABA|nr:uncharacterized protein G2W53_037569 [Senna tora]